MRKFIAMLAAASVLISLTACENKTNSENTSDFATAEATHENTETTAATTTTTSAVTSVTTTAAESDTSETEPSEVIDSSLMEYQQALAGTDNLCMVAFIGYYEGDYSGLADYWGECPTDDEFDFISSIPESGFVDAEGSELYLIIPNPSADSISLSEWIADESNGYVGEVGKELFSTDSTQPILLKCNVSDAVPNTLLNIAGGGQTLSHSLRISLYDGTLVTPSFGAGIIDATDYYGDAEITYDDFIRGDIINSGNICGAAYLGYIDCGYDGLEKQLMSTGCIVDTPYVSDIPETHFVDAGGYELYCIYPARKNATVVVSEWIIDESNNFEGESGKELYRSNDGEPVLVKCNYSDFMPNVEIVVTDETGTAVFYPGMSLENGKMILPDGGVSDMTVYREYIPDLGAADRFAGFYYAYVIEWDGEPSTILYLDIYEDGTAKYGYGLYSDTETLYTTHYEGTWEFDYDTYCYNFDFILAEGDGASELHTTQYLLEGTNLMEGSVEMHHYSGDYLTLSEREYAVYMFPAEG